MEPKDTKSKVEEQGQSKLIVASNKLRKLKSDYFIQKFFGYMPERKSLETIRYNKNIQKRIDININHYKAYSEKYSSIEIEIKTVNNKYGKFINIQKEEEEKYYHIYINNKEEEIKRNYINEGEEIKIIRIKID